MQKRPKIGVLLVNLGTPQSPDFFSVRTYLREFLWDPRVIETESRIGRAFWWLVLNLIILNLRPFKSAKLYRAIWTENGSPLLVESQRQASALQERLGEEYHVVLGMSYGSPSLKSGLRVLEQENIEKLIVLPLYPQYSGSTTGSVFEAVSESLREWRVIPELRFINNYYKNQSYINSLKEAVERFWAQHGRAKKLVFSFHGLPKKYCEKGDPYFFQCEATVKLLVEALSLNSDEWVMSFQSRVGRADWLMPYTDKILKSLPAAGVSSVQVFCPGFSVDCLETLEEIAIQNRDLFLEAGGKSYLYIPGLNSSKQHIEMMAELIRIGSV
jgi:protoporphyrin/coproporphyrin ferrochelatase